MIRDALQAYATTSERVWTHDRAQTIGASEIGQCARRIFFVKNEDDTAAGVQRDADHADGWGARARGSIYETHWWEPALRQAFGDALLYAGDQQRTFSDGFLSATPDALLLGLDRSSLTGLGVEDIGADCIVLDCKTIDPRARLDEAKAEHIHQIQVQIGLVRLRTNHRPEFGVLTYTNASFWSEVKEFPVRFDPDVFDRARRRATEIMTARSAEELRPEGYIAGGRECERCPYTSACGRMRAGRVPADAVLIDEIAAAEIAAKARTARDLKDEAEHLLGQAKCVEHEVRDLLAAAGTKRVEHGGVRVQWSPVKGRPSYDMKAIREAAAAAGVDLALFERAGDPTDRLVITLSDIPAAVGTDAAAAA